jgi:hypothetical protein
VDIERIGFDSGGPGNERMHELVRQHRQVMSQQYRKGRRRCQPPDGI